MSKDIIRHRIVRFEDQNTNKSPIAELETDGNLTQNEIMEKLTQTLKEEWAKNPDTIDPVVIHSNRESTDNTD